MKKATFNLQIDVPDDFTVGDCFKCPLLGHFSEVNPFDLTDRCVLKCRLDFDETNCLLEVKEEE